MIIDERTYTIRSGRMNAYLRRHFTEALPLMRQHLGEPYGYFVTEAGPLNRFVHLWRYEDAGDRETRRAALYADPAWLAYRALAGDQGDVMHQENRMLIAIDIPNTALP